MHPRNIQAQAHGSPIVYAGFHGQLGNNKFESEKSPKHISLGFKPCSVSPMSSLVFDGCRKFLLLLFKLGQHELLFTQLILAALIHSLQDQTDFEEETMPAVVACGAHHSTAISRKGELFSWGLGCNGELGLGRWGPIELSSPRQCSASHIRIVSVACGANHTLAIGEDGRLFSCGKNRHGQLGTNTMVDGSRLQPVMHLG